MMLNELGSYVSRIGTEGLELLAVASHNYQSIRTSAVEQESMEGRVLDLVFAVLLIFPIVGLTHSICKGADDRNSRNTGRYDNGFRRS